MCAWLGSYLLGPEYFISGYISENIYYLFFMLVFFVFCFESLFLSSPKRKSFPVQRSPRLVLMFSYMGVIDASGVEFCAEQ